MPSAKKAQSHASPARQAAFAALLEVERNPRAHADDQLRTARVSALSAPDRNLATTLVMGVLRWQIRLDALIRPLLARPNARLDAEILIALRLGAFQLLYLDRIPAHAAIGESVALAKAAGHRFASGMVNAVLRKLATQPRVDSVPHSDAAALAAATAHPQWLVERWAVRYGLDAAAAICLHGQQPPEVAIRLADPAAEAELNEQGINLAPGAILTAARRVISGDITAQLAFREGRVRIQEEGSQLIAELASAGPLSEGTGPGSILDACAAPGGKTMILAELNPQAAITACELSLQRLEEMRQRIAASAYAGQITFLQADASEFNAEPAHGLTLYDLILVDAPCSGTGTLGRNPEIRHRLQPTDLARHHERQLAILRGAMRASSHRILYSTCSLEPEENAEVVAEVLADAPLWRQRSVADLLSELTSHGRMTEAAAATLAGLVDSDGALTLLPGSVGSEAATDGFYVAVLEKQS